MLFEMTPEGLKDCLLKALCTKFDEEPPYDDILDCLNDCFIKSQQPSSSASPPPTEQYSDRESYTFEWKRNRASRVRNNIIAYESELSKNVEVKLLN